MKNKSSIEKELKNNKQEIRGMVIYCDICKKYTGCHTISEGPFTTVTIKTDCCDKIVK